MRRKLGITAPKLKEPLVLVGQINRKQVILAADTAAQKLGIKPLMPATQARAMVVDLAIHDADLEGDQKALEALQAWAFRHFSPVVSVYGDDGLFIDASGVAHLFGGEEAMLKTMIDKLQSKGIAAKVAIAPTFGAAYSLARYQKKTIGVVSEESLVRVFSALPISGLRISDNQVHQLRTLGFEQIGELEKTPRTSLALRFGSDLTKRLDQGYGRSRELFAPYIPVDTIYTERLFGEPIAAPEVLRNFIEPLVIDLNVALEKKGKGVRCLDLLFHRVDNRVEAIRLGLAKPTRTTKSIVRLLDSKLDNVDPAFGVEKMTLIASWVEDLTLIQQSNLAGEKQSDVSELLDTLNTRLGNGHVYQLNPVQSDVPERSVQKVVPLRPLQTLKKKWPRPVRLLPRPMPVETIALLPDHPPVSFTWKGERHKIRCADGPERIFGEWWKRNEEVSAVRDYFHVEDEHGERFWLFRAGDGTHPETGSMRWFIHGIFA